MERGGAWRRAVRRRGMTSTVVIPLAAPSVLTLYGITPSNPVVLSVSGVVAPDGDEVVFTVSSAQTQGLTARRYEYRITAMDPGLDDTVVLLRGYMTIYDGVQG